jgi:hypothetical protein
MHYEKSSTYPFSGGGDGVGVFLPFENFTHGDLSVLMQRFNVTPSNSGVAAPFCTPNLEPQGTIAAFKNFLSR